MPKKDFLLTVSQAATRAGITPRALRYHLHEIRHIKVDVRLILLSESSFAEWLAKRTP